MKREIVVARYNEDISWVSSLVELWTIYDKGGYSGIHEEEEFEEDFHVPLPNVGREGGTYLDHIVNEWDDLADWTLFLQGDPFPHFPPGVSIPEFFAHPDADMVVPRLWQGKEWDDDGRLQHWGVWLERFQSGKMRPSPFMLRQWFKEFLAIDIDAIGYLAYSPGACFAVRRDVIQRRPRAFYERILATCIHHEDPEEAYYVERMWMYAFMTPGVPLNLHYLR